MSDRVRHVRTTSPSNAARSAGGGLAPTAYRDRRVWPCLLTRRTNLIIEREAHARGRTGVESHGERRRWRDADESEKGKMRRAAHRSKASQFKKKKTALSPSQFSARLRPPSTFHRLNAMSAIAVRASAVRPVALRSAGSKSGAAPAPRVASIRSNKKSMMPVSVAAAPSFDELLAKGAEVSR